MKQNRILDTNIFVRYLLNDIPEQAEILEIALEYYNKYNLDLDDCYYLAYTKFKEWELFTFDTKLKAKAKLEGIKRMP